MSGASRSPLSPDREALRVDALLNDARNRWQSRFGDMRGWVEPSWAVVEAAAALSVMDEETERLRSGSGWYCARDRYWHKPYEHGKDPLFYMPCPVCGGALVLTTTTQVERDGVRAERDALKAENARLRAELRAEVASNPRRARSCEDEGTRRTQERFYAALDTPEGSDAGK